jgi:hypothetical protein
MMKEERLKRKRKGGNQSKHDKLNPNHQRLLGSALDMGQMKLSGSKRDLESFKNWTRFFLRNLPCPEGKIRNGGGER